MNRKSFGVGKREIGQDMVMKECPICHEFCFEDMEICFGCLHRFSEDEEVVRYREGQEVATRTGSAKLSSKEPLLEIGLSEKDHRDGVQDVIEDPVSSDDGCVMSKRIVKQTNSFCCNGFEICMQIKPL